MNPIKWWRARRARIAAERAETERLLRSAFRGCNPAERPSDSEAGE